MSKQFRATLASEFGDWRQIGEMSVENGALLVRYQVAIGGDFETVTLSLWVR